MSTEHINPARSPENRTRLRWGYITVPILLSFLAVLPQVVRLDIGGAIEWVVGVLFFPALVAYLVRGRKSDWKGFSTWFFWLGILLPALAYFVPLLVDIP